MSKYKKKFKTIGISKDPQGNFSAHHSCLPQPSDIALVTETIKRSINSRNSAELQKVLSEDFIYPTRIGAGINDKFEAVEWFSVYQEYFVRPMLEAVFFENNQLFQEILLELLKINDAECSNVFFNYLAQSNLAGVCELSSTQIKNINELLCAMQRYGEKLKKDDTSMEKNESYKGTIAVLHTNKLKTCMDESKIVPTQASAPVESKLRTLAFKLEFTRLLHAEDKTFAFHRGYKEIVGNILACVFSGFVLYGIASTINRCINGRWTFHFNTESENRVDAIQNTLEPTVDLKNLVLKR